MFNFNVFRSNEFINGYNHGFVDGAIVSGCLVVGMAIGGLIANGIKNGYYEKKDKK